MKRLLIILTSLLTWQFCQAQGVGIGTLHPNAPLQFANSPNDRKIVLYEVENNENYVYGFGVNAAGFLRYQTPSALNDHVFMSGNEEGYSFELMRIKGYGYVGIGANPTNFMDIAYGPRLGVHPSDKPLYVTGYMAEENGIEFRQFDGTQGIGFGSNTIYAAGSDDIQELRFASKGTAPLIFKTDGQERMRITWHGVGIGTDAPYGGLQFGNILDNRKIVLYNDTYNDHQFFGFGVSPSTLRYSVGGHHADHVFFSGMDENTSKELVRIKGSGFVGIGNSNPHAPLQFANVTASRKIVMGEIGDNDHEFFGFGLDANGSLRYQTGHIGYDHVFYGALNSGESHEAFRIRGTGHIGIGVSEPMNRLDINNYIPRTGIHPTQLAGYITGDIQSASGGVEIRHSDATQGIGIGSNTIYAAGSNADQGIHIAAKGAAGHISLRTHDQERLTITGNGNVGIGNTSPHAPLHFANVAADRKIVLGELADNDHEFFGFGIKEGNLKYQVPITQVDHIFSAGQNGTTSNELLRIKGNGNIGIAVSTPANKLDINHGTARSGSHATNLAAYITGNLLHNGGGLEVRHANGTQGIGIGYNTVYAAGSQNDQGIYLAAKGTSGNVGLMTNNLERLTVTGSGNVGIGINAPLNKMDITTGTRTLAHPTNRPFYVTGNYSSNAGGVEFRNLDGSQGIGFGTNTIYAAGSLVNHDLALETKGLGSLRFMMNGIEKLRILSNGKVGIGTSTPNAALQLSNEVALRKIVLYEAANNDHQFFGFGIDNFGGMHYQTAHPLNDHIFGVGTASDNTQEVFRITGGGYVGIGVSAPHAPLHLSNTILSKKFVLHESGNNNHQFTGLGVEPDGSVRYQTPFEWTDHVFYAGAGTSASLELARLEGNGNLTVQGTITTPSDISIGGNLNINGTLTSEPFATATLINGFTNFGSGYATVAYYKDKLGIVHLRGLANKATNHNGFAIFQLPAGYRPSTSGKLLFTVQAASGMSRVDIGPDGLVVVMAGSTGWIGLDGISFRAD